ncbi:type III pantothenate kinase [Aliidiomarina sp. Khilg15.8]
MILLEIGNTRWKLASYVSSELNFIGYGSGLNDLMIALGEYADQPVLFASVASTEVNEKLQQQLTQQGISFMQVETQRTQAGVTNAYDDYARLGIDRWLTLLAAHKSERSPCAIVDVGTAITFDLINRAGMHLGGWIAPGLQTMQESLVARSERISARDTAPSRLIGSCTEDGLFLGCRAALYGFIGEAEKATQQVFSEPVSWLFTGGGMQYIHLDSIANAQYRPHLVLEGLTVIADEMS